MLVSAGNHQVHIAFGKSSDYLTVAWATPDNLGASTIKWGTDCSNLAFTAAGDVREFTQDAGRTWYTRGANLTNLKVNTEYCYQVGAGNDFFPEMYKTTNRRMTQPDTHILFGDMGSAAAFALCDKCTQHNETCDVDVCKAGSQTAGLISEVEGASMFYHAGDFAYNLADTNGVTGDNFFKNIEQVASAVPYMVNQGNHEDWEGNLEHYVERFRNMPTNADPATITTNNGETANSLYFSFDHNLVHYISYSSELWEGVHTDKVTNDTFLAWLETDLQKANKNRDQVPWILISGHRALYTSQPKSGTLYPEDLPIKLALEPLLFKYGVDFCLNGHIHNYERSWPTYKGKTTQTTVDAPATIYLVSGAAGSKEMSSAFQQPAPTWSAFRSNSFSYSRMQVYNATHIHWQQVQTDPVAIFADSSYGEVIDDVWFVQHNHGPFSAKNAPTTVPATSCTTHDHFTPQMLDIDDNSGRPTYQQIISYKKKHGAKAFAEKMDAVLDKLNRAHHSLVWEDESIPVDTRSLLKWAGTSVLDEQ